MQTKFEPPKIGYTYRQRKVIGDPHIVAKVLQVENDIVYYSLGFVTQAVEAFPGVEQSAPIKTFHQVYEPKH